MIKRSLVENSTAPECEAVIAHFDKLDVDPETFSQSFPLTCPKVAPNVKQIAFEAGDRLHAPAIDDSHVFLVAAGSIREEVTFVDGRRSISRFLFRGDRLFDSEETRSVQYFAMDTGMFYRVPLTALRKCECASVPPEVWLTREEHRRIDSFARHALLLGCYTATEKVAAFLHGLVMKLKAGDETCPVIRLPMRRDEIADFLGLKAETVSRQLTSLRKQGILGLPKPGEIVIRDRDRLEALIPAVVENEK